MTTLFVPPSCPPLCLTPLKSSPASGPRSFLSKSTCLIFAPFRPSSQKNKRPLCHDVESSGQTPLTDTLESRVMEIFFQIGVSGRLLDPSSTGRLTSAKLPSHPYFSIKRACASMEGVSLTYREDIEGRPRSQEVTLPLAQYETPAAVFLIASNPLERTRLPPHPPGCFKLLV